MVDVNENIMMMYFDHFPLVDTIALIFATISSNIRINVDETWLVVMA